MREFIRIALRFGMILILLGGCAHNMYHLQKLSDSPYSYYKRYQPTYNYPFGEE